MGKVTFLPPGPHSPAGTELPSVPPPPRITGVAEGGRERAAFSVNTHLRPRPGTAQETWTGPGQPDSRLDHQLPLVAKCQNARLGTLHLGLALMAPFTPQVRLRGLCVWRLHQ